MKMKLPALEGTVITIRSNQKEAKRCYENNLKTKRGVFTVTTRVPDEEGVARAEVARKGDPNQLEMSWRGRSVAKCSNLASL